jgi:hypothetical protein
MTHDTHLLHLVEKVGVVAGLVLLGQSFERVDEVVERDEQLVLLLLLPLHTVARDAHHRHNAHT